MALLDIRIAPDPILRKKTSDITHFDDSLRSFLDDMFETMVANNGIGLAAPQVGVATRVAIIDVSGDYIEAPIITPSEGVQPHDHIYQQRLELVNPEILSGNARVSSEEGCLSIPDFRDSISRYNSVHVRSQDRLGRLFTVEAMGLLAFAIQHEIDHLNGILFVDHLSRLKKTFFRKWAVKHLGSADV